MSNIDKLEDKGLPMEPEAQRTILGAIMLNNSLLSQARGLTPASFLPVAGADATVFSQILELERRGSPIDLVTLQSIIRENNLQYKVSAAYLASLIDNVVQTDDIRHYVNLINRSTVYKRLAKLGQRVIDRSVDREDVAELLEHIDRELYDIRSSVGIKEPELAAKTAQIILANAEDLAANPKHILGIDTGLPDLNYMIMGWRPKKYYIIGARPSMGKSTLLGNFAVTAGKAGKKVLLFTLEQSAEEYVIRMLAAEAGVDSRRIQTGYLSEGEWARLSDALVRLAAMEIYIDESPALPVTEFHAIAKHHQAKYGLDIILADYLHLFYGYKETDSDVQRYTMVSQGFLATAKELGVPLIAAAQLNRDPENREDHRPRISDLRGSGSLEQDADVIMLLYRDEYYNATEDNRNLAELWVAKNKGGSVSQTKPIDLVFSKEITFFGALER